MVSLLTEQAYPARFAWEKKKIQMRYGRVVRKMVMQPYVHTFEIVKAGHIDTSGNRIVDLLKSII